MTRMELSAALFTQTSANLCCAISRHAGLCSKIFASGTCARITRMLTVGRFCFVPTCSFPQVSSGVKPSGASAENESVETENASFLWASTRRARESRSNLGVYASSRLQSSQSKFERHVRLFLEAIRDAHGKSEDDEEVIIWWRQFCVSALNKNAATRISYAVPMSQQRVLTIAESVRA